jgi:hypothetical protein
MADSKFGGERKSMRRSGTVKQVKPKVNEEDDLM